MRGSPLCTALIASPGGSGTGSTVFALQSRRSAASASPNTEASWSMSPTGTPVAATSTARAVVASACPVGGGAASASTSAVHSAALEASPAPAGTLDDTTSSTPAPGAPYAAAAATKRPHVGSTVLGSGGCPDQDTVPSTSSERATSPGVSVVRTATRQARSMATGRQNPPA